MAASVNENTPKKSCTAGSGKQMNDPNLDQLIAAAELLRPLLDELVFVGGCVTGLLITDAAAGAPRATLDVDAMMQLRKSALMRPMRILGIVCARWVSGRTRAKMHRCAVGPIIRRYSTLCP